MVEEISAQNDDSFPGIFRKHDAAMLLVEPKSGRIVDANPSAEKFYGYSLSELRGKAIGEIKSQPAGPLSAREERGSYGEGGNLVESHILADGEIHTVEVQSSQINLNGRVLLFSIIHDLTEHQKRAEEKLHAEEIKFHALAENIPSVIYQCRNDEKFTFIYLNQAVMDLTGYPPQAFLEGSLSFFDLYHPDDLPVITAPFRKPYRITYRIRHKSGEWRWVDEWGTGIRDEKGEVRFLEGVIIDITERKRMDAILLESEKRYRSLFENMIDGIYRSTHDGRFIDINPAMVKMFGYSSREEMLGIDIKKELYFAPEERGSHILDTGKQEIEAYRMRRKDGSEIWVEDHGYYVHDEQGNIIYHEGMLRDISERKDSEEALRQHLIELESLYNVLSSLRTVQTFDEALPILLNQTLAALGTETGTILLYHPPSGELRDTLPRGWFKEIQNIPAKAGEGVAGTVFATGQPYVSVEFAKDPLPSGAGRSLIPPGWGGACVPIRADSEIVGVIFVSVKLPRQITPDQLKLLNSLAEIAGATLHRTRLFDETTRRAREFASLYETSQVLSAETELKTMMQTVVDVAKRLLNASSSGMYFFIPAENILELTVDTELYVPLGTRMQMGEGVAGRVAQSRKPMRIDDYSTWESRSKIYEGIPLHAVLEVPMIYGGELIGVLSVDEIEDSERKYTEADERLLSLFASQAAAAIHSARLREDAINRLQHLQTLRTIDKAITSSLDINITLNILLNHVLSQLNVDAADVLLLHVHEQTLKYSAGRGFRTRMVEKADVHLNDRFAGRCVMERSVINVSDPAQIIDNPPFARLWKEEGFQIYFCVPLIAKGEVKGVLEVYRRSKFSPSDEWFDFLETLASQAAITIDNTQMFDNVQRASLELAIAYEATIEGWSHALDLRDRETEGHTQRVTELTMTLAGMMGIEANELQHIRRGALLHDIGKMGISDRILLKKGKLTKKEWEIMRTHPTLAFQMLQPISYLRPALDIPYCHHEKWDGSGYPRGLKGEQIPLMARIFSVVDVWDALTSLRSYRKAWTKKRALTYIKQQSGKHFDPRTVEVFLQVIKNYL